MASLQKNIASQNFPFSLVNASSGAASTTTSTSSLTAFVTKDGTQAGAGGTFSYLGTGEWNYVPTQAETNCTSFALYVTAGSTNIPFHGTVWTDPANFNVLSIDSNGNVATTSNIKKNTASSGFSFVMTNPSSSPANGPFAGLTVSGSVSIDGGAFQTLTNSVVEIGQGAYKVNLAAADTNGNHLLFQFTAMSANTLFLEIITQP